jgi:hypothetical protein
MTTYACPNGCANGACVGMANQTTTTTTLPLSTCRETDGGLDYYVQGNTTGPAFTNNKTVTLIDHCFDSTILNEGGCNAEGYIGWYSYNCPNGCAYGACQTTTTTTLPQRYNLQVYSTPSNASVWVDNIYRGITPRLITNLTVGSHLVRITKAGCYQYNNTVNVYTIDTTVLDVTLTQMPCTDSDGGLNYYLQGTTYSPITNQTDYCSNANYLQESYCLNGVMIGTTYICPYGCIDGACINQTTTTTIPPSTTTTDTTQTTTTLPPTGNLYVTSSPSNASLYVDNVYRGGTPWTVANLNASSHIVRLLKPGYATYYTTVNITAGQTKTLAITLTQIPATVCIDSDGGLNYYVRGTTYGTYTNSTDYCADSITLQENYCLNGTNKLMTTYACPNGCLDGACINQTATIEPDMPTGLFLGIWRDLFGWLG